VVQADAPRAHRRPDGLLAGESYLPRKALPRVHVIECVLIAQVAVLWDLAEGLLEHDSRASQ
jgi:hypothetical protein